MSRRRRSHPPTPDAPGDRVLVSTADPSTFHRENTQDGGSPSSDRPPLRTRRTTGWTTACGASADMRISREFAVRREAAACVACWPDAAG